VKVAISIPIPPAGSWRDIGQGHANTSAEGRSSSRSAGPEAAIEGDGLQRLIASFQHYTRGIDAGSELR
jgi:hypothetical protein